MVQTTGRDYWLCQLFNTPLEVHTFQLGVLVGILFGVFGATHLLAGRESVRPIEQFRTDLRHVDDVLRADDKSAALLAYLLQQYATSVPRRMNYADDSIFGSFPNQEMNNSSSFRIFVLTGNQ